MTDKTRWLDADEQQMWRAFIGMSRLLFAQLDTELQRDHGIQASAYGILVRLSEAPDRTLRMSELADSELFSRSRLSHAVNRLEEAGWVRRSSCDTDKRGAFATLTNEGYQVLEDAAPSHVEAVRSYLFDPLTRKQAEQLRNISETVLEHLHAHRDVGDTCTE